ncbi:MAG: 6-bladed beta-propeller [Candidatus Ozemobacteraceae bacterium]
MKILPVVLGFLFLQVCPLQAIEYSNFVTRGFEGKGELEFILPEDIVAGPDGEIIVADQKNNRIQVLNPDLTFRRFIVINANTVGFASVSAFLNAGTLSGTASGSSLASQTPKVAKAPKAPKAGTKGDRNDADLATTSPHLDRPVGLALDRKGRLLVSSSGNSQIYIFQYSTGALLGVIGKKGRGQGMFDAPLDIDVSPEGLLAVADSNNRRIQIFDADGKFQREIYYKEETAKKELRSIAPRGVHWLSAGELIVSYPMFCQVACWEPKGSLLWRYGIQGNAKGELYEPSFIGAGPAGHVLISDSRNHRIVEITATGLFVKNYPIGRGSGPGRLFWPRGIIFGREDALTICDQGNNRIQIFRPSKAALILREAKVLAEKDRWDEAMPKIEQVLNLQPDDGDARLMLVNALHYFGDRSFQAGDFEKSEEYFRRVLIYNPNDLEVAKKLDMLFWASNKDLIMRGVIGLIGVVAGLLLLWVLKIALSRLIFGSNN